MSDPQTLTPRKGHYFDLGLSSLCWLAFCLIVAYLLFNLLYERGRLAFQLTGAVSIVLLSALVMSFRPGRFVVIDIERRLVSKPSLLRQRAPHIVPAAQIQSYGTIRSVADKDRIVGVLVLMKDGRKFRYSDKRTPGVARIVLELMSKSGAVEEVDGRQLIG